MVPQSWGGAKPLPASLIGSPEQITYLVDFNLQPVENANKDSVQTSGVCVLYQNQEYLLIGVLEGKQGNQGARRVLSLKKDQIRGLQEAGGNLTSKIECNAFDFYDLVSEDMKKP